MDAIERAIESAKNRIYYLKRNSNNGTDEHVTKACKQIGLQEVTISALKKQMPQNPVRPYKTNNGIYYNCPECGHSGLSASHKHCWWCGQALDWNFKKCGNCHLFKNGCDFSKSNLPDETLKNYIACADYIDTKEFSTQLDKVEKVTSIGR